MCVFDKRDKLVTYQPHIEVSSLPANNNKIKIHVRSGNGQAPMDAAGFILNYLNRIYSIIHRQALPAEKKTLNMNYQSTCPHTS